MNPTPLRYAGFWPRLGSLLLDGLIMAPIIALFLWGNSHYRLFGLYYFIPSIVFGLFFHVYLVRRYGGTPGKLLVKVYIRKVDGTPVGYREAVLRHLPHFLLSIVGSIAILISMDKMTDTEFQALTSRHQRYKRMSELAPSWSRPVNWVRNAWYWSELIVLLTNRRRRALHDFIAGTVVVHASPDDALPPTIA